MAAEIRSVLLESLHYPSPTPDDMPTSLWRALALGASVAAAAPLLQLQLSSNGGYSITDASGVEWFGSTDTTVVVSGVVYSISQGNLHLIANTSSSGTDGIGSFVSYSRTFQAAGESQLPVITTFKVYSSGESIGFTTTFPQGAVSQAQPQATGGLASNFPLLTASQAIGSIGQDAANGNCGFLSLPSKSLTSSGGILLLSPATPSTITFAVAAVDQQPVVRQAVVQGQLAAGPGAEFNLPPGWSATVLLTAVSTTSLQPIQWADWGFPLGGSNHALFSLGQLLLDYHNKSRPAMNFDRTHETLGYSVCGFYFYNPCDCGKTGQSPNGNATCGPDDGLNPHRVPNCTSYEDTLLAVHAGLKASGIPYGHMLIDSWWYGEDLWRQPGVQTWEDGPFLENTVKSFPHGLKAFASVVAQDGVVMWAHNGRWTSESPYIGQYPFAGEMPQGRALWDHLFSANSADWNLVTIKQDHVQEQIAVAPISNASQVDAWLGGMGQAASDHGVAIQYCCSPPLVLLNSVNVPAATGARSSPDYVQRASDRVLDLPLWQWANGVEAAFHYSIGLMPDKDTFFSNSSEVQHGGDGLPADLWPAFYNWTEVNPTRHALSAVLSGGPVAPSDAVGATNATLVRALMRGDGTILRPSRPHTAVDTQFGSMMFGAWQGQQQQEDNEAHLGSPSNQYPNYGRGEVYSTVTLIPASTASTSRASSQLFTRAQPLAKSATGPCLRWTYVTASMVSVPVNLTARDLALDSAALAGAACVANDAAPSGGPAWVAYEWSMDGFGPVTDGNGLPAVQPIFSASAQQALPIVQSQGGGKDYSASPSMTLVAPVTGGWVILGEQGKMVPVSPQRISSVVPATGGSGVTVGLVGQAGETASLWACGLGSGSSCSPGSARAFACTLSAGGTATLSLPAGTCA